MKKRQQPHPQRVVRIEKIFGPSEQVPPEKKPPGSVKSPHQIDEQRGNRLAGNQKAAVGPEADTREQNGDVTELKEVGSAPGVPVSGHPNEQPSKRGPSQQVREFGGAESRRHDFSPENRRPSYQTRGTKPRWLRDLGCYRSGGGDAYAGGRGAR